MQGHKVNQWLHKLLGIGSWSILLLSIVLTIDTIDTLQWFPCPIKTVTGYECPSCGLSHAFINISHGDFASAYHANALVFVLYPIVLFFAGILFFPKWFHTLYLLFGQLPTKWIVLIVILFFAGLLGFAVGRNLM